MSVFPAGDCPLCPASTRVILIHIQRRHRLTNTAARASIGRPSFAEETRRRVLREWRGFTERERRRQARGLLAQDRDQHVAAARARWAKAGR